MFLLCSNLWFYTFCHLNFVHKNSECIFQELLRNILHISTNSAHYTRPPLQCIVNYLAVQFRPGLVDCRQPYGEGALETSHCRSYITCLTAAILPCFHFNHECSCAGEQRGSAMLTHWRLEVYYCWYWSGCLQDLIGALCSSAASSVAQINWMLPDWVSKCLILSKQMAPVGIL